MAGGNVEHKSTHIVADDVLILHKIQTSFVPLAPIQKPKQKYLPERFSVIITGHVRRFAYILASEKGCVGRVARSV
jgi:hypothetical protein